MDINWQFNNPANPADAAIGPQGYDNHLYYRCVADDLAVASVKLTLFSVSVASPTPTPTRI